MALNVVLISQRQSATGVALTWTPMEGVSSYEVFVASKKLTPEELEACAKSNGNADCAFAKLPGSVASLHDDISPEGEQRFYGVAMLFSDGTAHAARARAAAAPPADAFKLSKVLPKQAAAAKPAPPPPAPVAAAPAPAEDPLEERKRQQREAREKMSAVTPPKAVTGQARLSDLQKPPAVEDELEARKRAQREAREKSAAAETATPKATTGQARLADLKAPTGQVRLADLPKPDDDLEARKRAQQAAREKSAAAAAPASAAASNEPPPPPSAVPLEESIDLQMHGATQTWDGLRIYWDRDPKAVAYEIIASDHQVFRDELRDVLAGSADFTTATAVAPAVTCVIDNTTARDSRGWYAVLARYKDGTRAAISFKLGDAGESGKVSAPFLNPNRTGELRAEVEGLIADAREQWDRWKSEQDNGAKHEAKRMVGDALLMWPDYPAAKKFQSELS